MGVINIFDTENQIIKIRINNFNSQHFKDLGYVFEYNGLIEIFAKELPNIYNLDTKTKTFEI